MASQPSTITNEGVLAWAEASYPTSQPEQGSDLIMHAVEVAINGFRHMEVIVQSRLQNFLVADSILLAGWATVFASQRNGKLALLYSKQGAVT